MQAATCPQKPGSCTLCEENNVHTLATFRMRRNRNTRLLWMSPTSHHVGEPLSIFVSCLSFFFYLLFSSFFFFFLPPSQSCHLVSIIVCRWVPPAHTSRPWCRRSPGGSAAVTFGSGCVCLVTWYTAPRPDNPGEPRRVDTCQRMQELTLTAAVQRSQLTPRQK